ncbi:MAG: hypothetical protein LQ343_003326 [Gyalolechia ehrenbergii]|nr:MAG: hypothetical protein LQ343_003326 [Gyalolechia ehrenbergii]
MADAPVNGTFHRAEEPEDIRGLAGFGALVLQEQAEARIAQERAVSRTQADDDPTSHSYPAIEGIRREVDTGNTNGWLRLGASRWLSRLFLMLSVAVIALALTISGSSVPRFWPLAFESDHADLGHTPRANAFQLWNIVPLPAEFNPMPYEPLVNKLPNMNATPRSILSHLLEMQSSVNSSLETLNNQLTERFACALKRYELADDTLATVKLALLRDVVVVREQIQLVVSNVSLLQAQYTAIEQACRELNSTLAGDLEKLQATFLFRLSPIPYSVGSYILRKYAEQWDQSFTSLEEVQAGITAFKEASGILVKTEQIAQEIDGQLDKLAAILKAKGTTIPSLNRRHWKYFFALSQGSREQNMPGSGSHEVTLKDWFQLHVARSGVQDQGWLLRRQFEIWWTHLKC